MLRVDRHGVEFIAGWESFVPWTYDDKTRAQMHTWDGKKLMAPPEWEGEPVRGTLTIGFGHTDRGKDPLKCTKGKRVTKEEAYRVLDVDMNDAEAAVNRLVKVPLSQGQFDALVDFVFNAGAGTLQKSSLLKKLNAGDYAGAQAAFDLYVFSKGQKLAGLQRRADARQILFDNARPNDEAQIPHEDEEFHETPKEVDRPKKTGMGGQTLVQGAGAAMATAGGAAKVGEKLLQDDADKPVQKITTILDHTGSVVDTVTSVVDKGSEVADQVAPAVPLLKGLVTFLCDPVVLVALVVATVALCLAGYLLHRRHAPESA